jgi:hypothetical protein|tara:strand:+ start:632 stop:1105 length:474 start_codon:yes stop_codon:yes gene_type:complete
MSIRRQGWDWGISDLGNLPAKFKELETSPQSVFYSGIGDATLLNRNRTKDDQFIVLQYVGSTPGVYGNGENWVPGGYVNIRIGTTFYYETLDGRDGVGMSGTAAPYPISTSASPVLKNWIPIEIPPGTDWDVTYYLSNAMISITEDFPETPISTWTV